MQTGRKFHILWNNSVNNKELIWIAFFGQLFLLACHDFKVAGIVLREWVMTITIKI